MSDYIRREDAVDLINKISNLDLKAKGGICVSLVNLKKADVVPYSIAPDGTLTITVPKGTYEKVGRVLVEEDGTHWGGLFYAD